MRNRGDLKNWEKPCCTQPQTLHPQPCTLHPKPHTLHPTPYTLNPTPYTPNPIPYAVLHTTAHSTPAPLTRILHTLNPEPWDRNPHPCRCQANREQNKIFTSSSLKAMSGFRTIMSWLCRLASQRIQSLNPPRGG